MLLYENQSEEFTFAFQPYVQKQLLARMVMMNGSVTFLFHQLAKSV